LQQAKTSTSALPSICKTWFDPVLQERKPALPKLVVAGVLHQRLQPVVAWTQATHC
jgi:hypothetical protein